MSAWGAPPLLGGDRCGGCGRPVLEEAEGRCSWCRRQDRGDSILAAHDRDDPDCYCCELAAAAAARADQCAGCGAPATGAVAGDRLCDGCQPVALRHLAKGRPLPWRNHERRPAA